MAKGHPLHWRRRLLGPGGNAIEGEINDQTGKIERWPQGWQQVKPHLGKAFG